MTSASPAIGSSPRPRFRSRLTPLEQQELLSRHSGAMKVVRDYDQHGRALILLAVLTGDQSWLEHLHS